MSMRALLETPLIVVECDDEARVVTMVRTRAQLPLELAGLRAFYSELVHAFDAIDRSLYALIVDGRAAVGRNDEAFESAQAEYAERLFDGYRKVLALVSTTVGRMQLARYSASRDRETAEVFSDIDEAFAYVAVPRPAKLG